MKKTIPEKIIISCDFCKEDRTGKNNNHDAKLILKAHALDYSGSAVANGDYEADLCDSCYLKILHSLKTTMSEVNK